MTTPGPQDSDTDLTTATRVPREFRFDAVPERPGGVARGARGDVEPDLGPLKAFTGDFRGFGFNTIFRPQFPSSPAELPDPQPNSDNILELNLTEEILSFQRPLGRVPNRGAVENDVFLNGVPYLQTVEDVTDPTKKTGIHLEPGLWVITPPTEHPSQTEPTLSRMASIPHGTTINAQGTFIRNITGPIQIDPVDITPFLIDPPHGPVRFPSQTVADEMTPRVPQKLANVPAITQTLLDNPNQMLLDHLDGATLKSFDVFFINTDAEKSAVPGGGTDNIGFLVGDTGGPNADAIKMSAIFWVETIESTIEVGPLQAGEIQNVDAKVPAGAPQPVFRVESTQAKTDATTHTVTYTQIQYTQNVSLNFQGLTWPHISVATLVPAEPIPFTI